MNSIKEVNISGKRVLLRADLDVPLKDGEVADDFRIQAALPTIKYLIKQRAEVIIIAHLDRPGGKVVEKWRLDPIARWLVAALRALHLPLAKVETGHAPSLRKVNDCVGPDVKTAVAAMTAGDVLLLGNLRFHPGEEENGLEFARSLASLANIYVNDCFANSHRKHASIVGLPKLLPSYAGLRLEEEATVLYNIVTMKRPLLFIVGGAKAETKAPLVRKLSQIADKILLGGTLMFEQSLEGIPNVLFPIDAVGVEDIGPETVKMFVEEIERAKTVVWNGPMGVTLKKEFEVGTRAVAEALAKSDAYTIVGGGDTVAALKRFGLCDKMDFVSTGGGAMLQFLADGTLPGLEALR